MSETTDTRTQIESVIQRLLEDVPALGPLQLVVGLELRARGDTQQFRVELPGPDIAKGPAPDARIRVEMPRAFFNEMAKDARIADWEEAFFHGQARASGAEPIIKLVVRVVELAQERARARRRAKQH